MPVIVYLEAGERGAEPPTGHNNDRFSRDSVMVAAIVAGGARARKSGVHEKVGNVVHRPPIDVLDVCFLRESAEKPMREYFEYSDEWCDLTTAACGTAMRCYKRHKEPIPLTALRPPVRFALVDVSPRASRSDAAAATGGGRERPPKLKIWCVPSGARQEALLAITKDRLDGLDVQ